MWRFCEVYDDFYGGFLSEDGDEDSFAVRTSEAVDVMIRESS